MPQDATAALATAERALAASDDPALVLLAQDLADAVAVVSDVAGQLAGYVADLDADPARLAEVLDRRAAITAPRAQVRRPGGGPGRRPRLGRGRRAGRLSELDVSDEALEALDRRARRRPRRGRRAGRRGSRPAAAPPPTGSPPRWARELAGLAMKSATVSFSIDSHPDDPGPEGIDEVALLLAAHPGAPPRPVHKGASGGELSRVMLAIEVVFAGADPVPVMVFDEVDAGVGGQAAGEIGRRLARLARDHQVVVVTHLAQVAAFADTHLVVDKSPDTGAGVTATDIRAVEGEDRVRELARMLSGLSRQRHRAGPRPRAAGRRRRGPRLTPAPGTSGAAPRTGDPTRRAATGAAGRRSAVSCFSSADESAHYGFSVCMLLEHYRDQLRWEDGRRRRARHRRRHGHRRRRRAPCRACGCAASTSARRRSRRPARTSPPAGVADRYTVELGDFFDQADSAGGPPVSTVISNPPYIPAPDRDILMPELWGGVHGNDLVLQLLKAGYDNVIAAVASYSDPVTTVRTAGDLGYRVVNFLAMGLDFGPYSNEPKVRRAHPAALRRGPRLGRRGRLHGRRRPVHPGPRRPRRPRRPAAARLQLPLTRGLDDRPARPRHPGCSRSGRGHRRLA